MFTVKDFIMLAESYRRFALHFYVEMGCKKCYAVSYSKLYLVGGDACIKL